MREKRDAECRKSVDQIAYEHLTPEQRKILGPSSFFEQTSIGSTISDARNLFSFLTTGTTDAGNAHRALNANRAAAIKFKAESCTAKETLAPPVTAASSAARDAVGTGTGAVAAVSATAADSGPPGPTPPGQKILGLGGWEGEVLGHAAPGGKFETLRIGMAATAVIALIGPPDDQRLRDTPKMLIPFYFGSDRQRLECAYRGVGRLVFSSSPGAVLKEMHLIRIIHDAAEAGTI